MAATIRVLVVDDHPMVRSSVVDLLSDAEGIVVVGEAADGREAVDLTATLCPHVVLMDVNMPGISGPEATHLVMRQGRGVAVLMLSADVRCDVLRRARDAGAMGFLPKGSSGADIVQAIRAVNAGETAWPTGRGGSAFRPHGSTR
ncbi:response regulator transcription factor [Blastococcus sp. CT_GayMR16]|uniref:response regulator n=1 Tax=Blastococcus sp. CT_GayMR16 TaxID=2559607 RepID=UPI001073855B|nr:response regulator transcription factor [Blastococcus sp. CT_GayMR16]TFV91080.1 response regulator transcription factor [Blastococcus sp. CT_GayMR16]